MQIQPSSMEESPAPPPPLFVLRGHRSDVTALDFCNIPRAWLPLSSSSARLQGTIVPCLISGDGAGLVTLWDLRARRPLLSFAAQRESILQATVPPEAGCAVLLTQGKEGGLTVWSLPKLLELAAPPTATVAEAAPRTATTGRPSAVAGSRRALIKKSAAAPPALTHVSPALTGPGASATSSALVSASSIVAAAAASTAAPTLSSTAAAPAALAHLTTNAYGFCKATLAALPPGLIPSPSPSSGAAAPASQQGVRREFYLTAPTENASAVKVWRLAFDITPTSTSSPASGSPEAVSSSHAGVTVSLAVRELLTTVTLDHAATQSSLSAAAAATGGASVGTVSVADITDFDASSLADSVHSAPASSLWPAVTLPPAPALATALSLGALPALPRPLPSTSAPIFAPPAGPSQPFPSPAGTRAGVSSAAAAAERVFASGSGGRAVGPATVDAAAARSLARAAGWGALSASTSSGASASAGGVSAAAPRVLPCEDPSSAAARSTVARAVAAAEDRGWGKGGADVVWADGICGPDRACGGHEGGGSRNGDWRHFSLSPYAPCDASAPAQRHRLLSPLLRLPAPSAVSLAGWARAHGQRDWAGDVGWIRASLASAASAASVAAAAAGAGTGTKSDGRVWLMPALSTLLDTPLSSGDSSCGGVASSLGTARPSLLPASSHSGSSTHARPRLHTEPLDVEALFWDCSMPPPHPSSTTSSESGSAKPSWESHGCTPSADAGAPVADQEATSARGYGMVMAAEVKPLRFPVPRAAPLNGDDEDGVSVVAVLVVATESGHVALFELAAPTRQMAFATPCPTSPTDSGAVAGAAVVAATSVQPAPRGGLGGALAAAKASTSAGKAAPAPTTVVITPAVVRLPGKGIYPLLSVPPVTAPTLLTPTAAAATASSKAAAAGKGLGVGFLVPRVLWRGRVTRSTLIAVATTTSPLHAALSPAAEDNSGDATVLSVYAAGAGKRVTRLDFLVGAEPVFVAHSVDAIDKHAPTTADRYPVSLSCDTDANDATPVVSPLSSLPGTLDIDKGVAPSVRGAWSSHLRVCTLIRAVATLLPRAGVSELTAARAAAPVAAPAAAHGPAQAAWGQDVVAAAGWDKRLHLIKGRTPPYSVAASAKEAPFVFGAVGLGSTLLTSPALAAAPNVPYSSTGAGLRRAEEALGIDRPFPPPRCLVLPPDEPPAVPAPAPPGPTKAAVARARRAVVAALVAPLAEEMRRMRAAIAAVLPCKDPERSLVGATDAVAVDEDAAADEAAAADVAEVWGAAVAAAAFPDTELARIYNTASLAVASKNEAKAPESSLATTAADDEDGAPSPAAVFADHAHAHAHAHVRAGGAEADKAASQFVVSCVADDGVSGHAGMLKQHVASVAAVRFRHHTLASEFAAAAAAGPRTVGRQADNSEEDSASRALIVERTETYALEEVISITGKPSDAGMSGSEIDWGRHGLLATGGRDGGISLWMPYE